MSNAEYMRLWRAQNPVRAKEIRDKHRIVRNDYYIAEMASWGS